MSEVRQGRTSTGSPPGDVAGGGRSPWVVGIIIGFMIMVLVNLAFITIAVKGADAIVPSYETAER